MNLELYFMEFNAGYWSFTPNVCPQNILDRVYFWALKLLESSRCVKTVKNHAEVDLNLDFCFQQFSKIPVLSQHFQTVQRPPLPISTWHASDLWTDGKHRLVNMYSPLTKPLFQSVISAPQMFITEGIDPLLFHAKVGSVKVNWKTRQQISWEKVCRFCCFFAASLMGSESSLLWQI